MARALSNTDKRLAALEAENVWLNQAVTLLMALSRLVNLPTEHKALEKHVRHFVTTHAQRAVDDMRAWHESGPTIQWYGNLAEIRAFVDGTYTIIAESDMLTLVNGERGNVHVEAQDWIRRNPYNGNIERIPAPKDFDIAGLYQEANQW